MADLRVSSGALQTAARLLASAATQTHATMPAADPCCVEYARRIQEPVDALNLSETEIKEAVEMTETNILASLTAFQDSEQASASALMSLFQD